MTEHDAEVLKSLMERFEVALEVAMGAITTPSAKTMAGCLTMSVGLGLRDIALSCTTASDNLAKALMCVAEALDNIADSIRAQ